MEKNFLLSSQWQNSLASSFYVSTGNTKTSYIKQQWLNFISQLVHITHGIQFSWQIKVRETTVFENVLLVFLLSTACVQPKRHKIQMKELVIKLTLNTKLNTKIFKLQLEKHYYICSSLQIGLVASWFTSSFKYPGDFSRASLKLSWVCIAYWLIKAWFSLCIFMVYIIKDGLNTKFTWQWIFCLFKITAQVKQQPTGRERKAMWMFYLKSQQRRSCWMSMHL